MIKKIFISICLIFGITGWLIAGYLFLLIGRISQGEDKERNAFMEAYFNTTFHDTPLSDIDIIMTLRPDLVSAIDSSTKIPYAHEAVVAENVALVKLFLDHGVNPNMRMKTGETMLHFAAQFNKSPAIAALLLSRGAAISMRNNKNQTALDIARARGNTDLVTYLELYDPLNSHVPKVKSTPGPKLF